jgi:SP family general alpha glucoside:H+ symporter-like MFS transporter
MLTFVGQGYRGEANRDEIALVESPNERSYSTKNQEAVSLASTKDPEAWTTAVGVDPQWITVDSNELPAGVWAALQEERQATALRCCRQHPKAVAWSLLLFFTVVMEAYDKSLISGFMAFPAFQRRYGAPIESPEESREEQRYEISAAWQMGLQNGALACEIIGLLAHGYITYVTGYRKMLILCLLWLTIAIFPSVFATSIGTLAVGQALCGMNVLTCLCVQT